MRRPIVIRATTLTLACALLTLGLKSQQENASPRVKRWFKGNLHTHTLNSDGDSAPLDVAQWYKQNGYQFLVLSDHNVFTATAPLNSALAANDGFLLVPGEEVTARSGSLPVHLNAYNPRELIPPAGGATLGEVLQRNIDAILRAGGLPALNHPNFGWAVRSRDALPLHGLALIEVYNGHPEVNNRGGGGAESLDEIWDALLTAGKHINGIAVDDAHHFKKLGKQFSNPGRGWIQVHCAELSTAEIMHAIGAGDFYASTGVVLESVDIGDVGYRLKISPVSTMKYTTYFLGSGGKVLAKSYGIEPAYRLPPGEPYVRARVEASNGDNAWTQPLFAPNP
jgi:predicted metal-dependent phosphoesterase TrpH